MKTFLLSLPLICFSLGCAASYNVGVNGYSASGQNLQISQVSSIYIIEDSNAPNPILEKEVAAKIRNLLTDRGYNTGIDKADFYLLFDYGIDPGQAVTDAIPVYHAGRYDEHRFSSLHRHGYTTYIPYSSMVYTRWLLLRLVDGQAYAVSQKAEPLWICEVASAGMSSDLRQVINYMLIAAFEHLGQDTGRQLTEVIFKTDERVRSLAER